MRKREFLIVRKFIPLILLFNLLSCSATVTNNKLNIVNQSIVTPSITLNNEQIIDFKVKNKLASLSLEEKVGQLFITTPNELVSDSIYTNTDKLEDFLTLYPVGGLIYFSSNIIDPIQTETMVKDGQKIATEQNSIPLFMALDEEGGRVSRIANNPNFDVKKYSSMQEIGSNGNLDLASEVGDTIATYLKEYGFNLDLAPVADILSNENNLVIGDRSFSSNPDLVSEMSNSFASALIEGRVIPCFKHFPGHGSTVEDSHDGLAYNYKSLEELKETDFIPFIAASQNEMPMIMVAHIALPSITDSKIPASLSKEVVTGILKEDLKYQGLIITDSLAMNAITDNYSISEASILALEAGVDIILIADSKDTSEENNFKNAYQAVIDAVENGELDISIVDQAVSKILKIKYEYLVTI